MDLNISSALSGNAGLAGVQWLLLEAPAHEALLGALQDVLQDGTTIGAIQLQRAKYKPGRYLTTYHAVDLHGASDPSTRLIEVKLYEALVLTKSTVRRMKLFDRDWAPRTERLIGRATEVLDRLAVSSQQAIT